MVAKENKRSKPRLVAIVGGSGAGKSWLAAALQELLGKDAARLSLDDFYCDRSHLSFKRREKLNFDHPRAICWTELESVLKKCIAGENVALPQYDFATHSRRQSPRLFKPKSIVLVDGLWLLHRRSIRNLFDVKIFVKCPQNLRLSRRYSRDCAERGRNRRSVQEQFNTTVAPMHNRFVAPQERWADLILKNPITSRDVERLAQQLVSPAKAAVVS